MNFLSFLQEGIIVPPKLSIKTTDIKKLNKQFKGYSNPEIIFKADTGPHGSYVPALDQIIIYVDDSVQPEAIEAILQHEIIHSIQDKKSGMRMMQDIQKQQEQITALADYVDDLDDEEEIDPLMLANLEKQRTTLQNKMEFLNHEEMMTYSYMYAKMYKAKKFKVVLKQLQDEWLEWTDKKVSRKMMKYFAMYWQVRKDL